MKALCSDLRLEVGVVLHSDASAAIGVCKRRGLGRIRHLAVADRWIQDRLRTNDFTLCKIAGSANPADVLTKHVDWGLLSKHLTSLDMHFEQGRAESAAHV